MCAVHEGTCQIAIEPANETLLPYVFGENTKYMEMCVCGAIFALYSKNNGPKNAFWIISREFCVFANFYSVVHFSKCRCFSFSVRRTDRSIFAVKACAKCWWKPKGESEKHTHARTHTTRTERKRAHFSQCAWKYYNLKNGKRWNGAFCILVALYLITPPRESKNLKRLTNAEGMYVSVRKRWEQRQ